MSPDSFSVLLDSHRAQPFMHEAGLVYIIRHDATGREYVGCTRYDLDTRWRSHLSGRSSSAPLPDAIRQFGAAAFSQHEVAWFPCVQDAFSFENATMRERDTFWPAGFNRRAGRPRLAAIMTQPFPNAHGTIAPEPCAAGARAEPRARNLSHRLNGGE